MKFGDILRLRQNASQNKLSAEQSGNLNEMFFLMETSDREDLIKRL